MNNTNHQIQAIFEIQPHQSRLLCYRPIYGTVSGPPWNFALKKFPPGVQQWSVLGASAFYSPFTSALTNQLVRLLPYPHRRHASCQEDSVYPLELLRNVSTAKYGPLDTRTCSKIKHRQILQFHQAYLEATATVNASAIHQYRIGSRVLSTTSLIVTKSFCPMSAILESSCKDPIRQRFVGSPIFRRDQLHGMRPQMQEWNGRNPARGRDLFQALRS